MQDHIYNSILQVLWVSWFQRNQDCEYQEYKQTFPITNLRSARSYNCSSALYKNSTSMTPDLYKTNTLMPVGKSSQIQWATLSFYPSSCEANLSNHDIVV